MKKKLLFLFLLFINISANHNLAQKYPFKKVIIWGHKLHSHTHSYIHWGFYRTFKHLGYETYWFDINDNVKNFDFADSLFITEGQVDKGIPLREDCRYILHNCTSTKYKKLVQQGNCITLQVYTNDVLSRKVTKIGPATYIDISGKIVYMPWATDLLPYEIDKIKEVIKQRGIEKKDVIFFVGSVGTGEFGNSSKIVPFKRACQRNNISFQMIKKISMEKNVELIQNSIMAPALQGEWQCKQGYIPCRIFKNISYGQFGITNSKMVWELFDKKIVYNPDTYQLFYDAINKINNLDNSELFELMDIVRDQHTYINRITVLLEFLDSIKPITE